MKSKFYLFLAIILLFGVFVSAQNNLLNTTVYMPSDEYFSESKSGTYLTWNKIHYIYLKNNNSANLLSKKINFCMDLFFNSNLKYERVEGDFCNRIYFFKPQKSMVFYYNFSLIYIILLIGIYFVYRKYYRGKIILEKKIKFLEKSFHGIKKIRVEMAGNKKPVPPFGETGFVLCRFFLNIDNAQACRVLLRGHSNSPP
ncbi:hypothetical protein HN415_05885, partial [Candidatus Woesearchaeota archaeon]|nr:hypothetical protein [Candidatus Woesearchaeota archaeon]